MSASWETYPGTTDRIMLITGRPEEVINAQSLVWDNITQQIADEGKHDSMHHTDIIPSKCLQHFISVIMTALPVFSLQSFLIIFFLSLTHTRTFPFSSHICHPSLFLSISTEARVVWRPRQSVVRRAGQCNALYHFYWWCLPSSYAPS